MPLGHQESIHDSQLRQKTHQLLDQLIDIKKQQLNLYRDLLSELKNAQNIPMDRVPAQPKLNGLVVDNDKLHRSQLDGFVEKHGETVLYKAGQPYTGLAKNQDGKRLLLYKNGKPHDDYELAPSSNKIRVQQGHAGDCDLLATFIGIFSNPNTQAQLNRMCAVNEQGDLVITCNVDPKDKFIRKIDEALSQAKKRADLRSKGYTIDLDKQDKTLIMTVAKDKFSSILLQQQSNQARHAISGATTNSLFIMAIEHLMGNVHMLLNQTDINLDNKASLAAHGEKKEHSTNFISHLLGYKNRSVQLDPRLCISRVSKLKNIDHLLKYCEYLDARQIGVAYHNSKGFVFLTLDYGKADANGVLHGRHALTLNKIIRDKQNKIIGLELVNPWDRLEVFTLDELIKRNTLYSFYSP